MTHRELLLFTAIATLAACTREAPPAPTTTATTTAPAASSSIASSSPGSSPVEVLDRMDARTPVPLLPMMAKHQKQNMRDHLVAVQEIVGAVATKDFAAVERSAGKIGFSEQMGAMCTHMGAGAPGFTEQALAFHHTADKIGVAAKKRDADAVLAALNETLTTCTRCHQTFKQQVVDDATWTRVTNMAAPSGGMHH